MFFGEGKILGVGIVMEVGGVDVLQMGRISVKSWKFKEKDFGLIQFSKCFRYWRC